MYNSIELKKQIFKDTDLFVLDMDGTFYLENDILDGALDFLDVVKKSGKRYIFFTNNSSTSAELYIEKLAKMNCHITRDMIMTSGDVMIRFLKTNYPGKKVYLLGTKPLEDSFEEAGITCYRKPKYYPEFNVDQTNLEEVNPDLYNKLLQRFKVPETKGIDGMY